MGCDIHLALECKVKDKWVAVKFKNEYQEDDGREFSSRIRYPGRSYGLFNILSFNDVRVNREQLNFAWEPRDLPEDVSDQVQEESSSTDYHTHSHLTLSEIKKAIQTEQVLMVHETTGGITDPWKGVLAGFYEWTQSKAAALLPGIPESKIRIVFWYDN